jgi:predicted AAA+ superfamily ATPase
LELKSYLDYYRLDDPLTYWRSRSRFEVDFVIGNKVAIEVKSKSRVSSRDYKGILAFGEEVPLKRKIVVCREKRRRRDDDGVEIIPVTTFLKELWKGKVLD